MIEGAHNSTNGTFHGSGYIRYGNQLLYLLSHGSERVLLMFGLMLTQKTFKLAINGNTYKQLMAVELHILKVIKMSEFRHLSRHAVLQQHSITTMPAEKH